MHLQVEQELSSSEPAKAEVSTAFHGSTPPVGDPLHLADGVLATVVGSQVMVCTSSSYRWYVLLVCCILTELASGG